MSAEKEIERQQLKASKYKMINVGKKRVTHRRAFASGTIIVGNEVLKMVKDKTLPKGDVLSLAEISGILGAKKTPDLLPMCHILPLDQVLISCELSENDSITVFAQVEAHAKTGVEMEALMAVMSALGTIWDLTKGIDPALEIKDVKLLAKEGGKNGLWLNPDGVPSFIKEKLYPLNVLNDLNIGILVVSDRASKGEYIDKTGKELSDLLSDLGASTKDLKLVPDEKKEIKSTLTQMCKQEVLDVIIVSGGTGIGPRDVTTEAISELIDKEIPGIGELLRQDGANFTPYSWISRSSAGIYKSTLIISLPGSPKAVRQGVEILCPILSHSIQMIGGKGHE